MSAPGAGESSLGSHFRRHETVSPLELFFDLIFVLAITQCTALMAGDPTWGGIGRGLLVLGLLWWSWVGYAWLTSAVDPDDGPVRFVLFTVMAALLVLSLCVPKAFGDLGVAFAVAYGVVRCAQITLFWWASRSDPLLHRSLFGLAASTVIGVAVLVVGSLFAGHVRVAIWTLSLVFDMVGPFLIEPSDDWRFVPGHFAERHGLIIIVALGESIVAIGVAPQGGVDGGVITAAVLAFAGAYALWWTYFNVTGPTAARRLVRETVIVDRNRLARDAYTYLHLPMVTAIVLMALGMRSTLAEVSRPLPPEEATALVGGAALYLLAHVAFRARALGAFSPDRLGGAFVLLAFLPFADNVEALVAVVVVSGMLWATVLLEFYADADARRALKADANHGDDDR